MQIILRELSRIKVGWSAVLVVLKFSMMVPIFMPSQIHRNVLFPHWTSIFEVENPKNVSQPHCYLQNVCAPHPSSPKYFKPLPGHNCLQLPNTRICNYI